MGGLVRADKIHPRVRALGFRMRRGLRSMRVRLGDLLEGRLGALKWQILAGILTFLLLIRLALFLWYLELPPHHPSFLCSFGLGRLGNQLSSLATMVAFSREFGLRPLLTQEQADHLSSYFDVSSLGVEVLEQQAAYYTTVLGYSVCRLHWVKPWTQVSDVDDHFNYSIISSPALHHGRAIDMGEYPNVVSAYKTHLSFIRTRLKLKQEFVDVAQDRLHGALTRRGLTDQANQVTWVGVHNRRGDYAHHLNELYSLPLLGADYFHRAMTEVTDSNPGEVIFVIVSDDLAWAHQHLNTSQFQVEFLGHSAVLPKDIRRPLAVGRDVGEDLALLAACNSSILSYGTFGMWAALLSGGDVVMSPTMARTKEGEELREGALPGWRFGGLMFIE